MPSFVYWIASDKIGNQDPELGTTLMTNFMVKLVQAEKKPTHLLLVERGVQLLLPQSPVVEALRELEREGVELLACQTCLDFYGIRESIAVGKVSNMPTIIQKMHSADNVISL